MRIGFVYDARDDYRALGFGEEAVAEFDPPETLDGIESALTRMGHAVERIGHGRNLAARLGQGDRWDLVFSIAEGVRGRSREAQVPALCELFDQPYAFSDPLTNATTLDKGVAKRLVRDHGVPTAPFAVIGSAGEVGDLPFGFPAFVKPVAEGTGKGCEAASRVASHRQLKAAVQRLVGRFDQPVIVEPYLPGREFTIGVVGNGPSARVIAVMEVILLQDAEEGVYSLLNKEQCERYVRYELVQDEEARRAAQSALCAYHALGCRDAARLDFRSDASGEPMFLEVNPLAGLHPHHSDLPILAGLAGVDYDTLMAEIVGAAQARYGLEEPGLLRRTS